MKLRTVALVLLAGAIATVVVFRQVDRRDRGASSGPTRPAVHRRPLQPYVLRGKLVPRERLRAVVGLTYLGRAYPNCGGALIEPDMVLTAAHCLCGPQPEFAFTGENPFADDIPPFKPYYRLGRGVAMSKACASTSAAGMIDIAVVPILGRVGITEPLGFAADAQVRSANSLLIMGFGATNIAGNVFDYKKREAVTPLVTFDCMAAASSVLGCHTGQELVAGRADTPDTCIGDSGSALLLPSVNDPNRLLIAGIVSRGVKSRSPCGAGGIYERITPAVAAFIRTTVERLRMARDAG